MARRIGEENMKCMIFVDGLIVCQGSKSKCREKLNKWVRVVAQYGIKFNAGKSKHVAMMGMENREEA